MHKPEVGQRVRVTTEYPDHYIYSETGVNRTTYEGTVLRPEPWYKDDQFKLEGTGRMVFHTISMTAVTELEVL